MKLKSGRELTQLEIIKRLNLMGIEYNSDILGKNYYIDLYNKAIQSKDNLAKIKENIENDEKYAEFLRQNNDRRNLSPFKVDNKQSFQYAQSIQNNNNILGKNCGKRGFFSDFDFSIVNKILITRISYDFVDRNGEYIDKIGNKIPNFSFPFQALKKCTLINIYPEIISKISKLLDIVNYLISDNKFILYVIICFFILIIIVFILFRKGAKNRMKKRNFFDC